MHALEWLGEGSARASGPVSVVFGDDAYLVRESIQTVSRVVFPEGESEGAISRFPGALVELADVLDELFTLPFFSRRRLVIVEDADPFVTKYRKELEAYVADPSATGILLIQSKQWLATTRLAKLIDRVGLVIDCSSVREKDAAKLISWLIRYARTRCDAQLDAGAAQLLVELVGLELGILVSEVEKLAIYAGDSKRIERGDVAKMVEAGRVETIWKVLDAATTGQGATALKLLDDLLAGGESPQGLLPPLSSSLLKLHHAGRLRAARLSLDEACWRAGIPTWAVDKTGKQHAHLGPRRVDRLPAMLLRADLDLKGGSALDPRVVLELLVVGLARPRTD